MAPSLGLDASANEQSRQQKNKTLSFWSLGLGLRDLAGLIILFEASGNWTSEVCFFLGICPCHRDQ